MRARHVDYAHFKHEKSRTIQRITVQSQEAFDPQRRTRWLCIANLRQRRERSLIFNVHGHARLCTVGATASPGTTITSTSTITATTTSTVGPIEARIDLEVNFLFLFTAHLVRGLSLEYWMLGSDNQSKPDVIPCRHSKLVRPHSSCVRQHRPKHHQRLHWLRERPPA
jgi:hypothetical protein